MKYKFITAIHFLELENKEMLICLPSGYISNKKNLLDQLFHNNLTLHTLGLHSIDEIYDAPSYYVIEGDLSNCVSQNEANSFGTSLCFALLRQIQSLVNDFWEICDNSIYVRDGFLYIYSNDISDGCTFKASVSMINSLSTGQIKNTIISEQDILRYGEKMDILVNDSETNINIEDTPDYKSATQFQHYKKSGLSRKELAKYYVLSAHGAGSIPMKVLMYCSAIEALVANSTTELSHRVAERVAILLGSSQEERYIIYSNVKFGYDTRSKVAHGDSIKKDETKIRECSKCLDEYLRKMFKLNEPYNLKDSEIDSFYLKKLFS